MHWCVHSYIHLLQGLGMRAIAKPDIERRAHSGLHFFCWIGYQRWACRHARCPTSICTCLRLCWLSLWVQRFLFQKNIQYISQRTHTNIMNPACVHFHAVLLLIAFVKRSEPTTAVVMDGRRWHGTCLLGHEQEKTLNKMMVHVLFWFVLRVKKAFDSWACRHCCLAVTYANMISDVALRMCLWQHAVECRGTCVQGKHFAPCCVLHVRTYV